jgi:hypothetical protein
MNEDYIYVSIKKETLGELETVVGKMVPSEEV